MPVVALYMGASIRIQMDKTLPSFLVFGLDENETKVDSAMICFLFFQFVPEYLDVYASDIHTYCYCYSRYTSFP